MDQIQLYIEHFKSIQFSDLIDILLVAAIIFFVIPLLRNDGIKRIFFVIAAVLLVTFVSQILKLHTLNYLFSQLSTIGLIAIVVLFQPEIRRVIDHLSNVKIKKILNSEETSAEMVQVIRQTVRACEELSKEKIGALIVFQRDSLMDEYSKTGTIVDAQVSEQLLRNIFFPKAALHDGATIIRHGRVFASGCVLPLSDSVRLHADLGTRHRAAVGVSEVTDAVVVVVSEETGVISVAVGGMLKRHLAPQTLERLLRAELCHDEQDESGKMKLLQKFKKKDKGGVQQ